MTESPMDVSQQKQMWHDFTRIIIWSTVGCLVVIALMAAFLTP